MSSLAPILVVMLVMLLGRRSLVNRVERLAERLNYAREFGNLFVQYVNSEGRDQEAYGELTRRVPRMQRELGSAGYVSYRPAFANYIVNNYAYLLNELPALQQALGDPILSNRLAGQHANGIREALLRHDGVIADALQQSEAQAGRPVQWFVRGVQTLVGAPVRLLEAFQLVAPERADAVTSGFVFRMVAGVVGLVTFVASLVTIFAGWETTVAFLKRLGQ